MKQKYKNWVLIVVLNTSILYLIVLFIFNYVIDIDHIFHIKETDHGRISGDIRYGKIEYLEKNFQKYNSYIIGGSRSGIIQAKSIEQYIKGSKFYNLSITFNKIGDSYLLVKYIIDHYNVKNIMLQISGSDFQPTVPLNLRDHFKVSRKNSLLFYCSCFFSLDIQHTLNLSKSQKILSNYFFKPTNVDGSWDCKEIEEYIRKKTSNCLKHSIMNSNEKHFKELYSDSTLDFLKSIKKYCELNDVRLLIHFVPDNHSYFDQFDSCRLNDLLRKISEITDFWYFSGYNSITANDTNYYDIIHYRLSVADLMIKKIFTDTVFEPKDFGIYLTVANINQVIDFTNKQFINRDTINN